MNNFNGSSAGYKTETFFLSAKSGEANADKTLVCPRDFTLNRA
jgi:hypothetical protein